MSPEIATDRFLQQTQTQYNLQYHNNFRTLSIRSAYHGSESILFLGPKIWNYLLPNMKQSESLNGYKKQPETRNLLLPTLQNLYRWCKFYKLKPHASNKCSFQYWHFGNYTCVHECVIILTVLLLLL